MGSEYESTATQDTTTERSKSLHLETGSRQALRQHLEDDPNAVLMVATLKFPLSRSKTSNVRRLRYGTEALESITVDMPHSTTMRDIVFGHGDSVQFEIVDVDVMGGEVNPIRGEFTHEGEGDPKVETETRGLRVYNIREIDNPDEVERIVGSMLPAGATGQEVTDPENNPLGGDGTVEGTVVGRRPMVPPNPNRATGVGTTIGSPPGTGTA